MFAWVQFSIKRKLIIIIMASCAVALLMSTSAFISYDINTFKSQMLQELNTLARIIGDNSTATIVFNDKESAKEILSALKNKTHITAASTLVNGVPLASYYRDGLKPSPPALQTQGHLFSKNRLKVLQDVVFKDKTIGAIYLESDLDEINLRLKNYFIAIATIIFVVSIVIFFMASRLQRSISNPILELAQMTNNISQTEDYSVEIQKHSNDEIGQLFDEFNLMMRKIQSRDKRLKFMYEAQKEFTSTVSHELRTPLASIKMAIDLIIQQIVGTINNEQKDILGRAKQETDRLKRLIDDILDFTKIEAGKLQMNFVSYDIHQAIVQVVEAQREVAKRRGLYIKTDFDPKVPQASFDRDRIVQILENLISNAIKFTKQGGITVKTQDKSLQGHILVSVIDTGKGIAEANLPKLFQKFQQIESAQDNEEGGTGLGLAISKEIITRHGGKIWAESKPGEGTTFHFILPIQERRAAP